MPWKLDPVALRKVRLALKMDRSRAAELTGLAEFTLARHENKRTAPRHLQSGTAKAYAKVYKVDIEAFATWEDRDDARMERDRESSVVDLSAPQPGELERRAQRERELKLPDTITTPTGQYELLGNKVFRKIRTACKLFEGKRFALAGAVRDQTHLPEPAAWRVNAESGIGAMFTLHRQVAKGLTFYATLVTRLAEHTHALLERADTSETVMVVARLVVFMPEKKWVGFLMKEGNKRVPVPYTFVVEELVTAR